MSIFDLIAAKGDWLSALVPIVFFVIYVLNQLITMAGKNKKPFKQPRRPPAERPFPELKPAQPPQERFPQQGGAATKLDSEIEQFLKRASQRRGERPKRETASSPPKQQPKQSKQQQRPQQRPVARELPQDVDPLDDRTMTSVAESVQKHFGNRGFSERAEHLADDVVRAEGQLEQHLQHTFSRKVGTLTDGVISPPPTQISDDAPQVTVAGEASAWARMLADPANVRQAIVLSEILSPPEHRW